MFRRLKKKKGEEKQEQEKKVMILTCKIMTVRNHVSAIHVDMCACTVLTLSRLLIISI